MFEYKGTEKFDIGAGLGKLEYDFFTINDEDDFSALINHYGDVYKRFNYFLDGYKTAENNTRLSPVVQAKMKEHNANLCLTLLKEEFNENNVSIRKMIVNEQKLNGIYETYFFCFYHFAPVRVKDYVESGRVYAKYGLHNAAIKYFSHAIKLDHGIKLAFIYRGISYLEIKDYDKAIKDFTQAINFNTERAFSFRGVAYKEAGDLDRAKADLAKALELYPDNEMLKKYFEKINKGY